MYRKGLFILYVFLSALCYGQLPQDTTISRFKNLMPDMAKLQFAGGMGALSGGAGYSWLYNRCQSSIMFGFSPAVLSGKNIFTLGVRNTLIPADIALCKMRKLSPYAGATVAWSGYLPLQVLPHMGVRIYEPMSKRLKGIEVYAEATTTTREFDYFVKNRTVKWHSILNAGLGATLYFN